MGAFQTMLTAGIAILAVGGGSLDCGRVRQRPLRTQIANAHCEQELSHQLRAAPKIGLQT